MLKDKQTVMGFKTYEKEATQNKHVNAKTKQTKKLGFLGNGITHTRIGQCAHKFSLRLQARSCVSKSLPKKPKNIETEQKPNKTENVNLAT